jgi:beta-glucanase (GH16 family)
MNIKFLIPAMLILQVAVTTSCKKNETVPPDISVQDAVTVTEGNEQQEVAIIPVSLSAASDQIVSFSWSTSDGTAKAGDDYIAVTDSILVFQPGETTKNIAVKIVNDIFYESDEIFYVTAVNAKNGNIVKNRATVTITNDDAQIPVFNVAANTKVTEGNITVVAKVTVALTESFNQEVSIKWSTSDGTARAGTDYVAVSGQSLVFAPGEKLKYIEVQIIGDQILEFTKSFNVKIEEVTNALVGNTDDIVTITDDDTYTPEIAADGPITPDSYPGMQLVWSDEFDGTTIKQDFWTFETGAGGWGNNELENYTSTSANAFVADGKLNIVATKNYNNYYSARMITKGKKEFTYGRIDIRAKLPVGKGIWPALWMLGGNISHVGWPKCGEIDIMEYLGHDVAKVYGTAHYDDGGHQSKGGYYILPNSQGFNDKFHVFTILWQENSIVWYVDYQKYFEATSTTIKFDSFNLPQFFIFNIAIGGNWPGNPDATTVFPQTMKVDYVRVFQP